MKETPKIVLGGPTLIKIRHYTHILYIYNIYIYNYFVYIEGISWDCPASLVLLPRRNTINACRGQTFHFAGKARCPQWHSRIVSPQWRLQECFSKDPGMWRVQSWLFFVMRRMRLKNKHEFHVGKLWFYHMKSWTFWVPVGGQRGKPLPLETSSGRMWRTCHPLAPKDCLPLILWFPNPTCAKFVKQATWGLGHLITLHFVFQEMPYIIWASTIGQPAISPKVAC